MTANAPGDAGATPSRDGHDDAGSSRQADAADGDPLLTVADLRTHIETDRGTVRAVDGVSFAVERGETVCLVGESGSGKSVTCESITDIVPRPPAEIVGGTVTFDGRDLTAASDAEVRAVRGSQIAHVFQNPGTALDPVYSVGEQVVEAVTVHGDATEREARERAVDLFRRVGIPRADERFDEYPHEFSGGMQQRIALAVALAADPDLLIADEPTTSVDVTVQARLLELLGDLTAGGMAVLWVTHDLRVVAHVADRVLVMYGGTIVERGPVESVFDAPGHPYTQALFDSYRGLPGESDRVAREDVPTDGCRFRLECPHAVDDCARGDQPAFHPVGARDDNEASCVYYGPGYDPGEILAAADGVGAVTPATETAPDAADTDGEGDDD